MTVTRVKKCQDEPTLKGQDPRKTFFMVVSVANLDGSFDAMEGCEAMKDTLEEAEAHAKVVNAEYADLECYVFKCVPLARAWRGTPKLTKIKS